MTRRLFYIALGATAGVLLVRKITQTAEKLTPPKLVGATGSPVRPLALVES